MTDIHKIAAALVAPGKGVLAADESTSTAGKRLAQIGLDNTPEKRRDMREMLFGAANLADYISGAILFEETLKQTATDGRPLRNWLLDEGIQAGIKVDEGLAPAPNGTAGEEVTQGLATLAERLPAYAKLGATFAKWRAVYTITELSPSPAIITQNAQDLARYAKLCQQHNIVPIVEPEVLMNGSHTLQRSQEVTTMVLSAVFEALEQNGVDYAGMVLKPSMVISGSEVPVRANAADVARSTVQTLKKTVPARVAGVAFLSGGQTPDEATEHLRLMNQEDTPWPLTFSYGRALQQEALTTWQGRAENVTKARDILLERAQKCGKASRGQTT